MHVAARTPNASACSASPARSAIASPNATWHVGLPPTQRVVIHARKIVVDQRIRVDELDGGCRCVDRVGIGAVNSPPAYARSGRIRFPPSSTA
jgi:hypothetical protein